MSRRPARSFGHHPRRDGAPRPAGFERRDRPVTARGETLDVSFVPALPCTGAAVENSEGLDPGNRPRIRHSARSSPPEAAINRRLLDENERFHQAVSEYGTARIPWSVSVKWNGRWGISWTGPETVAYHRVSSAQQGASNPSLPIVTRRNAFGPREDAGGAIVPYRGCCSLRHASTCGPRARASAVVTRCRPFGEASTSSNTGVLSSTSAYWAAVSPAGPG